MPYLLFHPKESIWIFLSALAIPTQYTCDSGLEGSESISYQNHCRTTHLRALSVHWEVKKYGC